MKRLIFSLYILSLSSLQFANNLQVSNVRLTGFDPSANSTQVAFDLSWENSWRSDATAPFN
ncbi:MAG: hypothetical protein EA358_03780 [Flavobacteriales bacterium]|nr:MAG: hypothetical protein EA358_03780 [Flavobacteriales bacterium]